jgi:hypothetical protein
LSVFCAAAHEKTYDVLEVDRAWVAGLLEGEGCFFLSKAGRIGISCYMTDVDIINRLKEKTGLGNVAGPFNPPNPKHKPHWRWTVTTRHQAVGLMEELHPLMGDRRKLKIAELIEYDRQNPAARYVGQVHGTVNSYANYGCRCDECKRAGHEKYLARKAAR